MRVLLIILLPVFSICLPTTVLAQSTYVLPYPSSMPGSRLYRIDVVFEKVDNFWHFGSFGQFTYNLKMADKYLVEAKTLHEYKQYLLATRALAKSNTFFSKTTTYLRQAEKEGKNIDQKKRILSDASLKHIEVLSILKQQLPKEFLWSPEKALPSKLSIHNDLTDAMAIRNQNL